MKGCRPLTDAEVEIIRRSFRGINAKRTAALFIVGVKTGFRISELLSLRISDLIFQGKAVDLLTVHKRYMKGGKDGEDKKAVAESRTVPLHPDAHPEILEQWRDLMESQGRYHPDTYFFQSRQQGNISIDRIQAWRDLTAVYRACGLSGRIATHGMRKTFARIKLEFLKEQWHPGEEIPIQELRDIMGHQDIRSTQEYVKFANTKYTAAFLQS